MRFRQSTLKFGLASWTSDSRMSSKAPVPSVTDRSSTSPETGADADTIVVDTSESNVQLPTPSESATDVSSQDLEATEAHKLPKGRSKRVSRSRKSRFQEDDMGLTDPPRDEKIRSISGETLIASSISQSSLLQNGIRALDMAWNMSSVFTNEDKADIVKEKEYAESDTGSVITVRETIESEGKDVEDSDDQQAQERAVRKKVKMEENAKKWENRRKMAEKNATRRSNRASLLDRAGETMSDLATSVLGKRSRDVMEKGRARLSEMKSSLRAGEASVSRGSMNELATKRQRVNEGNVGSEDVPVSKKQTTRREKRWLNSGLYAGQIRSFDARLTETKNKKNQTQKAEPPKDNAVLPLPMFAGERLLKHGRDFKLPFDVFSPLPAGQPKPDEWRKTNKNVFIGDAAQEWRTNKFVEHSTCLCRAETGCDHNCMNRYMYYECDEKNCNLTETQCGNRAFEGLKKRSKIGGKYNVGVEVIKTVDRGHGVRSNRTFDPNQIIVEYTGEIITQEECESRMHTMYKDNECYYLMLFDQNMIIDATRGSIARFVNHSCEPNCRMEKWTVGGKPRMALFAGDRGIMTGEELTYDYNFDPYSQKNVQVCRCGASNCRGILGPKPKEPKQRSPDSENYSNKAEGRIAGAKRKVTEILEESTNLLNKKRKVEKSSTAKAATSSVKSKQAKNQSPKKVVAVKKVVARRVSVPKTTAKALSRRDSKLKKLISSAKNRSIATTGRRVASANSATEALLAKDKMPKRKSTVGRSSSLKEKATSLKRNMAKTVRGRSKSVNGF